jgi:hypothetical protein
VSNTKDSSKKECAACHHPIIEPGCEWTSPERRLYCWACAHRKLSEAELLLVRIDDAYEKPNWSNREEANVVMDAINDWLGDNCVDAAPVHPCGDKLPGGLRHTAN